MLKKSLVLIPFLCSGCVAILGGTYQTADIVSTGATAVSYGTTGKGITDHIVSEITGKDCRALNILKHKEICEVEYDYRSGLRAVYVNNGEFIEGGSEPSGGGWSNDGAVIKPIQNVVKRRGLSRHAGQNRVIKRSSKKIQHKSPRKCTLIKGCGIISK
jgi:hypothetical protein